MDTVAKKLRKHDWFKSIGIRPLSDNPTDLVLDINCDKQADADADNIRQKAEQVAGDIPVILNKIDAEHNKDYCFSRHDSYDELPGGISIHRDPDTTRFGTLTTGTFGSNGEALLLGCDYIMEENNSMYQPASDGSKVGEHHFSSPKEDMTAYETVDPSDVDYRGVESLSDLNGTWDFHGLADELYNNGPVSCSLSGVNSCTTSNKAVETRSGGYLSYHQVEMDERNAGGGDSGGPWVDDDNKLVAVHNAEYNGTDVGTAGKQALDSVNAQLYYRQ